MVGISSMLRLITLAIVAVGMSHAAAVATEVGSGIAVAEKAYMPDASAGYVFFFFFFAARILSKLDAFGYSSEAGSAPALAEKVEVPNVAQGYVFFFCVDIY